MIELFRLIYDQNILIGAK